MTRDELIAVLLELPNVDVCVQVNPSETLLAGMVGFVNLPEYGPQIVIFGVEEV